LLQIAGDLGKSDDVAELMPKLRKAEKAHEQSGTQALGAMTVRARTPRRCMPCLGLGSVGKTRHLVG
jgi:hypothetical protein